MRQAAVSGIEKGKKRHIEQYRNKASNYRLVTKVYISLGDYSIERKGIDNLSDGGQDGQHDVNRSK